MNEEKLHIISSTAWELKLQHQQACLYDNYITTHQTEKKQLFFEFFGGQRGKCTLPGSGSWEGDTFL